MSIRVLIVDQHEIMRAGIKQTCSERADFEFVGEAYSLEEGRQIALATKPDVAIIDPDCEGVDGLNGIRQLHREMPSMKILVFTAHDSSEHAAILLQAGAAGYLIKVASPDEIAVAIRSVHIGRIFISHTQCAVATPMSKRTDQPEYALPPMQAESDSPTPPRPLSDREQEVLSLLADGMTNKQAAEKLFLSVKTVETYRARIMKKHQLSDRAALVRFARKTIGELTDSA